VVTASDIGEGGGENKIKKANNGMMTINYVHDCKINKLAPRKPAEQQPSGNIGPKITFDRPRKRTTGLIRRDPANGFEFSNNGLNDTNLQGKDNDKRR
jgi:hypothetical protein